MSDKTGIEWTDATWNPVWGCTPVSPGCDHCYAETLVNGRLAHLHEGGFGVVRLRPDQLEKPLRWKRPRRIFVNSMSDLFHDDIPDDYIAQVFAVMALAHQHTFQVLTKRHGRMRSLLGSEHFLGLVWAKVINYRPQAAQWPGSPDAVGMDWPLRNVWLGVSVENQQWADIRIPALLGTPAAVRFLSCEPLLGPVNIARHVDPERECNCSVPVMEGAGQHSASCRCLAQPDITWVIVGGESGRGARPMHPEWVRSLLEQCQAAEIPFLFKQWGEWGHAVGERQDGDLRLHPLDGDTRTYYLMRRLGKKAAGRVLGGRTWDEYPQAVNR